MRKGEGKRWVGEKCNFFFWQSGNRLMVVRSAVRWYLSGRAERERERSRDTKWHSDGFLTAFFLLGPIFRLVTGHLFIYLPHFLMPQIAAVSLLMVRLHQEQGQPQCKIQWMREASRWCLWKWKYLAHYLCIYFYMWGSMVWHYNKRKPFSYHTILYVNCLLLL